VGLRHRQRPAALGLARHFAHVEATDASAQQVAHAAPAPNVSYSVQPAEATNFAAGSFDAVCVAQALHWFDFDRFNAEVQRVLRPGGILLVTGYGWSKVSPEFDHALQRAVIEPIAPFWPAQNQILIDGYRDVPFPYERLAFPEMAIEVTWTLAQFIDYMATWTATRRMLEVDTEFLVRAAALLRGPWGGAEARVVTMPLGVLCGRHGRR
jgi:SAM-dependent methyltransferase